MAVIQLKFLIVGMLHAAQFVAMIWGLGEETSETQAFHVTNICQQS
jgi:hypothetical protein